MVLEEITVSALAPFITEVGWHGFAYGLLGVKTIKHVASEVRGMARRRRQTDTADNITETDN